MKILAMFLQLLLLLPGQPEDAEDALEVGSHEATPLTISIHTHEIPDLGPEPLAMSLAEVLERADTQNLDFRASQIAAQVADAERDAERGRWWPSLSIGVLRSHTEGTLQGTFGEIGTSSFETAIANALLHWNLNPGETHFRTRGAEREAAAVHAVAAATRQETRLIAASLYLELVGAAALTTVAEQTKHDAEEFLDITTALEQKGLGPGVDVQRARAELARRRAVLAAAQAAFRIASARLAEALNLKPETVIVPRQGEIKSPDLPAPQSSESLIDQAISNRPEALEAAERVAAAGDALSGMRWAAYGPGLSVGLQEGAVGQSFADPGERTIYGAHIGWTFRPFQVSELRAAGGRLDASRVEEEKTRQRIRREVVAASTGVELARQNLEFSREGLEAAEQALQISQARFSGGLGSALEVLEAQEALAAARITAVTNLVEAHRGVFELQHALGSALPSIASEPSPRE